MNGGSSRFLTIAIVIIPKLEKHFLKRAVLKTYKKFGFHPHLEVKGSELKPHQREYFFRLLDNTFLRVPNTKMTSITVYKPNVKQNIRNDPNLLYNYMINLLITYLLRDIDDDVSLIRDERSIKLNRGRSLIDYLNTQIIFYYKYQCKLLDIPTDSKNNKGLVFIDWITNTIWRSYEKEDQTCRALITKSNILNKTLFF